MPIVTRARRRNSSLCENACFSNGRGTRTALPGTSMVTRLSGKATPRRWELSKISPPAQSLTGVHRPSDMRTATDAMPEQRKCAKLVCGSESERDAPWSSRTVRSDGSRFGSPDRRKASSSVFFTITFSHCRKAALFTPYYFVKSFLSEDLSVWRRDRYLGERKLAAADESAAISFSAVGLALPSLACGPERPAISWLS
jgi:hypothetical protein